MKDEAILKSINRFCRKLANDVNAECEIHEMLQNAGVDKYYANGRHYFKIIFATPEKMAQFKKHYWDTLQEELMATENSPPCRTTPLTEAQVEGITSMSENVVREIFEKRFKDHKIDIKGPYLVKLFRKENSKKDKEVEVTVEVVIKFGKEDDFNTIFNTNTKQINMFFNGKFAPLYPMKAETVSEYVF